jgi:hypothetical protein
MLSTDTETLMRIIKTKGRRGNSDFFWTVDGVASCGSVEAAADLAIDSLCELMQDAPMHTIWTVYA